MNHTCFNLMASSYRRICQLHLKDVQVPAPRNITESQRTGSFLGRFPVDSAETVVALAEIKTLISFYNKNRSVKNERLRLVKRGRVPIGNAKYGYGGYLSTSEAKYFDLYLSVESIYG